MTREDEIKQASKNRADQYSHLSYPVGWNRCYCHFKEGAEWADSTMIEKAAKWIATKLLIPGQDQLLDEFKRAMEE